MHELRVAEEGEEPDADALASIVRNQPSDSEEECSDHSLCYANVSERVSEEPEGRVPVFLTRQLTPPLEGSNSERSLLPFSWPSSGQLWNYRVYCRPADW